MEGRRRVLGPANGSPLAQIVLVGEAPGRFGAERTGVPFSGDASGRRLEQLLAAAGWDRDDVFITNAVLCNPRDEIGRNRPPKQDELRNCQDHLVETVELIQPRLLVALGRKAAMALAGLPRPGTWDGSSAPGELVRLAEARWAVWMLHPSPLTNATRRWADQLLDWQRLGECTAPLLAQLDA